MFAYRRGSVQSDDDGRSFRRSPSERGTPFRFGGTSREEARWDGCGNISLWINGSSNTPTARNCTDVHSCNALGWKRRVDSDLQDYEITMRVEHRVCDMGLIELISGDRLFEPPVILLATQTKNPARHRNGNPVDG